MRVTFQFGQEFSTNAEQHLANVPWKLKLSGRSVTFSKSRARKNRMSCICIFPFDTTQTRDMLFFGNDHFRTYTRTRDITPHITKISYHHSHYRTTSLRGKITRVKEEITKNSCVYALWCVQSLHAYNFLLCVWNDGIRRSRTNLHHIRVGLKHLIHSKRRIVKRH